MEEKKIQVDQDTWVLATNQKISKIGNKLILMVSDEAKLFGEQDTSYEFFIDGESVDFLYSVIPKGFDEYHDLIRCERWL